MIAYIGRQYVANLLCADCGAQIPPATDCLTFCESATKTYTDYCQACAPQHAEQAEALGILPKQRATLQKWADAKEKL